MHWLTDTTAAIARACGLDPAAYALDERAAETLLEVAGAAAHASGERTNAPLLCHVLGMMRRDGASLDDLARAVRDATAG
jgi:hypothetical protein